MSRSATFAVPVGLKLLLADLGLDAGRVTRRAGLPADVLAREALRLPAAQFYGLWAALEEEAADPALPVKIARALTAEGFDPPLFAATCCADLASAVGRVSVYKPLVGPLRLEAEESRQAFTVRVRWPDLSPPSGLALTELLFWVALPRLATRHPVAPVAATAPVPPADPAACADYLGVEVTRGPDWALRFAAHDARRPFLTANEPMWTFFEPELRRRLSDLDGSGATADQARASLLELLPAGDASMDGLARRLGLSRRTLQRRLQDEGTTFQEVLAETRAALAQHYLRHSRLSAAEISFLLGYEDPNSFYRAFHTWTGHTPDAVRAPRV